MMYKMSNFSKYLYCFIFAAISMFVFLIDYAALDPRYLINDSAIVSFFEEIFYSLKLFDFIYTLLFIFVFYFYVNVYFDSNKYSKKSLLCSIFSVLFVCMTILFKSYGVDNTLNTIYSSYAQIFKTILLCLGYYFIYYAILKKIVNIKFNINNLKKKVKLLKK